MKKVYTAVSFYHWCVDDFVFKEKKKKTLLIIDCLHEWREALPLLQDFSLSEWLHLQPLDAFIFFNHICGWHSDCDIRDG